MQLAFPKFSTVIILLITEIKRQKSAASYTGNLSNTLTRLARVLNGSPVDVKNIQF